MFLTDRNTYQKYPGVPMMYDVPSLRYVTSNKTYDFCMYSKFVNFLPIGLKIGTPIDCTYTMYHTKQYPITKHRAFYKLPYHPLIRDGILGNFAWRFQYVVPT